MSPPKPFAVGDAVAIYRGRGVPEVSRDTVTAVRVYKHRTKVTLASGQAFDGEGKPWESSYAVVKLRHWDAKAETAEKFAADLATLRALPSDEWTPAEASKIATAIRDVLASRVTEDEDAPL